MAKCGFSKLDFVDDLCGEKLSKSTKNGECIPLKTCQGKDIKQHLTSLKVRDSDITSEKHLILTRAGNLILIL